MKHKTKKKLTASRNHAVKRNQLNMEVNPRVNELITALRKNESIKLAMKGKLSNPYLVWFGLSLLAKRYKVSVIKSQLNLF